MSLHGVSVRKGKGMAKVYARGKKLYIDYMVDGERKRKATGLDDTKENRKLCETTIIPKLMSMIATGEIHKKKLKTFGHYYEIFLKRKCENSSYRNKKTQWDIANKVFGNRDIDTITRFEVKEYLASVPIMNRSKAPLKTLFNEIFEMGIDDRVIDSNPALNIRLKPEPKKEIDYFTKEEARTLIENAEGIMRPYLLLAFNTGMRPEEIFGLQAGDLKDGWIDIKRVRTDKKIRHPKTKSSIRRIPCPQFVIDEVLKLNSGNIFLFGDYDDARKMPKHWHPLLEKTGIRYRRLYACRHTFATTMLRESIVSISELSGMLGHANVQTTLAHYASVIDSNLLRLDKNFDLFGSFSSQSNNKTAQSSVK